jgi:hypothetical protein
MLYLVVVDTDIFIVPGDLVWIENIEQGIKRPIDVLIFWR